ncbi:MAG TPA: hypothetical protein VEQ59_20360, partial [Polyangiaceae bacterium]|nr:hypothetical protein [Polyangiaceae bacterium]
MGDWSRSWGVLLLVSSGGACSSSAPSDDPWDGRAPVRQCDFDPGPCLDAPGSQPGATELVPPTTGFRKFIETDDYVAQAGPACAHGFVYDLPRDKLLGVQLLIESLWPPDAPREKGLESCADYSATLHV